MTLFNMNQAAHSETAARQLCEQASLSIAQNQLEQAAGLCHQALQLQPDFALAHKTMGVILQRKGQWEDAEYWYHQALASQPDFVEVHANLGSLYATQKQWEKAINCYEAALQLQPNLAGVYRNLARICNIKNQPEKVANYQYQAFRLEPESVQVEDYLNLGKVLSKQNRLEQVIEVYSQGVKVYPESAKIYYFLGNAFSQQGQWQAAIFNYKQAIKIDPHANHYYNSLGDTFIQLQQWDDAIDCYLKSIKINPEVCWSYFKLADAYLECKQWENAIKTYDQGLKLNPDNYWPYIKIGDAFIEQEQIESAIAMYQKAQDLNPRLEISYYKLADALKIKKQYNEAIELYSKALEINSNLLFIYEGLGELLQKQKRWKEAIALYQKAAQLNPDVYRLYLKIALILKQEKNWYDAIDALIKTLELRTDCFEAYEELANIFEYQGYLETAVFCRHHKILPCTVIETFCQYSPEQIVSLDSAYDVNTICLYPESQIKCLPPITLDDNLEENFKQDYFQSSEAFVSIFPEGEVIADPILTSVVLNAKSQVISELSSGHPEFIISHNHHSSVHKLDETIAFLSIRWGSGGYFHWMFDVIARLHLIQKLSQTENIKIDKFVLSHCPRQYQIESLNILELTDDKIIESYHYPHLKAKQVIVPSLAQEFGISEWKCRHLKQAFLNHKMSPEVPGYKRIYIDRNKASYRKVINNEQVVQLLSKYGFQPIYLETLSIIEQVHYLNAAEVVVAPHGAGLTNLTFCNPRTKVIEIFSPGYVTPLYWFLSNICHLEHYYLLGERLPDDDNPKVSPIVRDIYVNLSQLEQLLKKADL